MSSETYVGWVPNVSGRLSFSVIGETAWPNRCDAINFRDTSRRIYCLQKRMLADTLVPNYIVSVCDRVETEFWFLLIAESQSQGDDDIASFAGDVYIIENYRAQDRKTSTTPLINRLTSFPHFWRRAPADRKSAVYAAGVTDITTSRQFIDNCYAKCRIEVDRLGRVRLSGIHKYQNISLYQTLRSDSEDNEIAVDRILYKQVFYFLKDIAHKHKHHAKKHDTIVSVTEEDGVMSWARETMYGLHRKVIQNRRSATTDSLCDAQGIIAYMKSFQAVLEHDKHIDGDKHGYKIATSYKLDQIDASIKAELEKIKIDRTQMNLFIVAVPVILFSAMNAFRSAAGTPENAFNLIHKFLQGLYGLSLTGGFLFVATAALMPFYYYAVSPHRISWIKDPYLTFRAFDKVQQNIVFSILLGLGPLAAILAYAVVGCVEGHPFRLINGMGQYYLEALVGAEPVDRITAAVIVWLVLVATALMSMPTALYFKQLILQIIKRRFNALIQKLGLRNPPPPPSSEKANQPE